MGLWWVGLAILSYIMQAINGALDKIIVQRNITKPIIISYWVAVFSVATIFLLLIGLLPFEFAEQFKFEPPTMFIFGLLILAGAMTQAGLLFMFRALQDGEATRVLSVMGALTPIITFAAAYVVLEERMNAYGALAFIVLIIGTITLTYEPKKTKKIDHTHWLSNALVASFLLALQSVVAKYVFDNYHFISAYSLMALGAVAYIVFIAAFSDDVRQVMFARKKKPTKKQKAEKSQVALIIGNSALGGIAVIILNFAISLGSPTFISAMRGVQYAGVFVIVLVLARTHPKLMNENLSRQAIMLKLFGIVLVSNGVILLAIGS